MRLPWVPVVLACIAAAACAQPKMPAPPSPSPAGWMRVSDGSSRKIVCGELPMLVDISHAEVTLSGRCGYVRVIGEHLDVVVEMAPGGTVDVTGAHDDVFWTQPAPGPRPVLLNRGESNTFHPPHT